MSDLIKTAKLVGDLSWYRRSFIPKLVSGKSYYKKVQDETGIPMAFVAAIHSRELASDVGVFKAYLGNGQPLNKVTTIVPKKRGPFKSWHEGAIDALVNVEKLNQIKNWDLETCIEEWEKYNGLGYMNRGKLSPYVWSGTNHGLKTGLFVKDGVYDPNAVDKNIGCYALYLLLIEQDLDFKIGEIKVANNEKSFWQIVLDFIKNLLSGKTNEEVYREISRIPVYGEKNDNVAVIQETLNAFGYGLTVDRDFGPKTKSAISNFQKRNGLLGSGVIGNKTIKFLGIKVVEKQMSNQAEVFEIASKEIGVQDFAGKKHNPRVLEYHQTTGKFSDDETSWCGSFVEWCLKQAGIKGMGSLGAGARNWIKFGVATTSPKKGDIAVFWRESKSSWKGHVGFYSHETETHVYVLGGNQSNSVNISAYPKTQLLGYRTY